VDPLLIVTALTALGICLGSLTALIVAVGTTYTAITTRRTAGVITEIHVNTNSKLTDAINKIVDLQHDLVESRAQTAEAKMAPAEARAAITAAEVIAARAPHADGRAP